MLSMVLAAVVFCYIVFLVAAASSPCIDSGPMGWPSSITGWHDDYKCYKGQVIDYR